MLFTGFVPDDDLAYLYSRAYALVQPSLMEGFGLPPVEAMACGTPVVSSTAGSLPEVVGEAGICLRPDRRRHRSRRVCGRCSTTRELRDSLAGLAQVRAKRFTWAASADALLAVFDELDSPRAALRGGPHEVLHAHHVLRSHSFGGDAAFVDRLSRALARHGHEVHVIHCRDAFEVVARRPDAATLRAASGRDGPPAGKPARPTLAAGDAPDRPSVLQDQRDPAATSLDPARRRPLPQPLADRRPGLAGMPVPGAVKLMTTHEHWLVCPLTCSGSLMARSARRPNASGVASRPDVRRSAGDVTGLMERSLQHLDALICPSRSTQPRARPPRRARADDAPALLPPARLHGRARCHLPRHQRPYVAAAGRLEKIKGFQDAIDAMRPLPGLDLRIAGAGAIRGGAPQAG